MGLIHGDDPLLPTPGVHDYHHMGRAFPIDQQEQLLQHLWFEWGLFDNLSRL